MSQLRTASAGRRTPARSAAGAPATPGVRTGFVIAAILAGQLQNILQSVVPGAGAVTLLDDVLVLIALALSLRFVPRLKGIAPPVLIVWMIVCGLALVLSLAFSPFSAGSQFALFRQILVPALLMLIGLTLQPSEWRRIAFLTIGLAVINAVYIVIEIAVAPLIDPKIFARVSGYTIYGDGYPSTYHGNDVLTGERVIRAGGLLLNPPIMGLFIGIAVVLAFYMIKRPWMRWTTTILLLIALYETNARGGILLAAIGLGAGFLIRWIGPWLATTLIVAAGLIVGGEIFDQGGSSNHVGGLVTGFRHALSYPLGRGFGYVGNARDTSFEVDGSAESLLGIAFSAVGLAAVAIIGVTFIGYVVLLAKNSRNWYAAVGIGILAASLLVESASALNGTVPIWLAAGIAFAAAADPGAWGIPLRGRTRQDARRARLERRTQ